MKMRHVLGAGLALVLLTMAGTSSALEESRKGPFYVQGTVPLGLNYWNLVGQNGYGWSGWRPDFEFGYHFSGRHDGFVLGIRQAFIATAIQQRGAGTTQLRAGYDIPIGLGDFELNIAPYGTFGVGYLFDGPSAGINFSFGVDGKFFITDGFYAFARPFEMGAQCVHDSGNCALVLVFGAGVGFAFPSL